MGVIMVKYQYRLRNFNFLLPADLKQLHLRSNYMNGLTVSFGSS